MADASRSSISAGTDDLAEGLAPFARLALAYAPDAVRPAWTVLLALDARLAGVVHGAREPLLAQIRLAWWRDRLREPRELWPRGEPLLAALSVWEGRHGALAGLVDGWEALLGEAPLADEALHSLVEGRAEAIAGLAELVGAEKHAARAAQMGRGWALSDLTDHLGHPDERAALRMLAEGHDWRRLRLPRSLRPLAVLHGMALRRHGGKPATGGMALLATLRLGAFGV